MPSYFMNISHLKVIVSIILLGLGGDFLQAQQPAPEPNRPEKPNVILLLADSLGWQDVKCYDIDKPSAMETPNIDALAKKGVLFWQAYAAAPTSSPSRCAIMSGIHPARAQRTHVLGGIPAVPYNRELHRMMPPWHSGRMLENDLALASVLKHNGYTTGHAGKWHMGMDHCSFPQPKDQGFDWTRSNLGVSAAMKPNRFTGFATDKKDDLYRLDDRGFARDQNNEDALTFIRESKDKAFFLYYATWLAHYPIQTRSKVLLDKYVKKLGVELPANPEEWKGEGQTNPFYCAMVEELDHYIGQLIHYLENTDDPRWPGHKLSENTYLILTSDSGGMETIFGQTITDNYPLDRGSMSLMEGGTRVPLIISGPGIKAGVDSEVMVNGLDFYPTILSLAGAKKPEGKKLDGLDISALLKGDATNASLVREADGKPRDTMVWHFPNSVALESAIRIGDYKLVRNYDYIRNASSPPLELYRLYNSERGKPQRVDIEEAKNLTAEMNDRAVAMNKRLAEILAEMGASFPYHNHHFKHELPNKENVPTILSQELKEQTAQVIYQDNGAKVTNAHLLYTTNGGEPFEEWFRIPASIMPENKVVVQLPQGTTHYVFNLIDQNNFLVSYPDLPDSETAAKDKIKYSKLALAVSTLPQKPATTKNKQE